MTIDNNVLAFGIFLVMIPIILTVTFKISTHAIFKPKDKFETTKDKFYSLMKELYTQIDSSFLSDDNEPFTLIYRLTDDSVSIMIRGGKIDQSIKIGIDDKFNVFINSFRTTDNKKWMAVFNKESKIVFGEIKEAEADSVHTYNVISYDYSGGKR